MGRTRGTTARKPNRRTTDAVLRGELCEMLRTFYGKSWISGTGGGICARLNEGELLLAPSGVHKERVQPEDFFVVTIADGRVAKRPRDPFLKPSECGPIFRTILLERQARSVMHSHALSAVLAADLANPKDRLVVAGFEMLKGIRGCSNQDAHPLPVIENTPEEPQLADRAGAVLHAPEFASAHCILVRDHGAYIWGGDVWEAKRHAEVYHFLFEGVLERWKRTEGRP